MEAEKRNSQALFAIRSKEANIGVLRPLKRGYSVAVDRPPRQCPHCRRMFVGFLKRGPVRTYCSRQCQQQAKYVRAVARRQNGQVGLQRAAQRTGPQAERRRWLAASFRASEKAALAHD